MYIYSNSCGVNLECETGYSLYFPCVKSITRGEFSCSDFYIVDNTTKKEVDLREIDDITLNISGRYNCNFGSYSYPENIKSSQVEKFSDVLCDVDFSDIINHVELHIDIVDETHKLIESYIFDENLILDIAIEGAVGYFLDGSEKYGILNLKGLDSSTYMFLGWNIEESDDECNLENIYDYLIKSRNLKYTIEDDCVVRAVYQKRREYTIQMSDDNYNSSFIVEYMGKKTEIREGDFITVLEGHDIKVSCIPNDVIPYKFVKWDDGHKNPYRILNIVGDDLKVLLKAYCALDVDDYIEFDDYINANVLNNFKTIYPDIKDSIFVDDYHINNIYINNCEIDILNDIPYIKIIENGYIQIVNINDIGNLKLSLNNIGEDCKVFVDNYEVSPSVVDKNEFLFEFEGGIITLRGNESCIFRLKIGKEVIYERGKCMLCLSSDDTLKLYPGELIVDGGVIVNGNPYGIPSVKFAKVTDITPLNIKNNTI